MIQRNILLRLRPEHQALRAELGQLVLDLLHSRPMVASVSVASWNPALEPEHPGWDLVVTVVFDDAAALTAYESDEVHAAFVRDRLAPLIAGRSSFSLELLTLEDQS